MTVSPERDLEAALVAAVRDRALGRSIPAALREHILEWRGKVDADERAAAVTRLVEETPALREYARRMWLRHETALAHAIAEATGAPADDLTCAALARFTLEAVDLARRHADPREAARAAFDLLEHGWAARAPGHGGAADTAKRSPAPAPQD
ncbi:hypothetical protein [Nonomuraea helvata]|uniref:MftR C-terminal domain-containing protein n=1 Tax=Nonomuraea helvata TaxID=37484 RepID=A0ABV5RW24_9ACTN